MVNNKLRKIWSSVVDLNCDKRRVTLQHVDKMLRRTNFYGLEQIRTRPYQYFELLRVAVICGRVKADGETIERICK